MMILSLNNLSPGIYSKVREVIDIESKYYLVGGDYPHFSKCMVPVCPWSRDILTQLDPAHWARFPAVLTTHLALDRKCVTMLRPSTVGNSSSYIQQALQELHCEDWARRTGEYLTDCELHRKWIAPSHWPSGLRLCMPTRFLVISVRWRQHYIHIWQDS